MLQYYFREQHKYPNRNQNIILADQLTQMNRSIVCLVGGHIPIATEYMNETKRIANDYLIISITS